MSNHMRMAAAALLGLAGATGSATAAPFLTANATLAQFDYDDVDDAYGGYFAVGYRGETSPLFFELGYLDTGEAEVDRLPGATANMSLRLDGLMGSVGLFFPSSALGSGVWVKGTYYNLDTEARFRRGSLPEDQAFAGTAVQSSSGAGFAFGALWKVTPQVGIRGELGALLGPEDFVNDENVTVASLGIEIGFGARQPAAATPPLPPAAEAVSPPPPPPPPPAVPPPPVNPPPVAVMTPRPDAAVAALKVAELTTAQPLRDQPRGNAAGVGPGAAGTQVKVSGAIYNREGHWRYVSDGVNAGWVPLEALRAPAAP